MPGLAGIIDFSRRSQNSELLRSFLYKMTHHDWYQLDIFSSPSQVAALGRVGLGIMNPGPQPVVNLDKSLYLFMDGEIYAHKALKKELESEGYRFPIGNDPKLILALFEDFGEECLPKLNGSFTIAIWDEKKCTLKIINDRYGLRPIYYAHHAGRLIFASEVKALLEDDETNKTIDEVALSQLFTFGYLLGDRTIFKGIKMFPPGSILTYKNDSLTFREYWDHSFDTSRSQRPLEWYVEGLTHFLPQAVNRQLERGHRTCISLSGGLDSRTVVGCIDRKYYPVHTFTFGDTSKCGDVQIAKEVANRLGTDHHFVCLPETYLAETAKDITYFTDGLMCQNFSGMTALSTMRETSEVILQGTFGDLMFGGSYLNPQIGSVKNNTEFCELLFRLGRGEFTKEYLTRVFLSDWPKRFYQLAFDSLRDILANYSDVDYFNRNDHFYLRNRLPRFNLLGLKVAQSQLEYQVPFFDNDLIEFYQKIPPELRKNSMLYRATLCRLLPQLAAVPWQKTGLSIQASYARQQLELLKKKTLRLSARNLNRFLGMNWTPKADRNFIDVQGWYRRNNLTQQFVQDILIGNQVMSNKYLNQNGVSRVLSEQFSGTRNHSAMIGRLLTLEYIYRLFLG